MIFLLFSIAILTSPQVDVYENVRPGSNREKRILTECAMRECVIQYTDGVTVMTSLSKGEM